MLEAAIEPDSTNAGADCCANAGVATAASSAQPHRRARSPGKARVGLGCPEAGANVVTRTSRCEVDVMLPDAVRQQV
jgi:hypothetical protein